MAIFSVLGLADGADRTAKAVYFMFMKLIFNVFNQIVK